MSVPCGVVLITIVFCMLTSSTDEIRALHCLFYMLLSSHVDFHHGRSNLHQALEKDRLCMLYRLCDFIFTIILLDPHTQS